MTIFEKTTVVVCIDARTFEQLKLVLPTWQKHRPEMAKMVWLFIYDDSELKAEPIRQLVFSTKCCWHADVRPLDWPRIGNVSQRDRMLTAWATVPQQHVTTEYYMKIDTDVVAVHPSEWLDARWFQADGRTKQRPVIVAPRWHYTKGVGHLQRLEEWGDKALFDWPRLNIRHDPTALRVKHPRFCSWICYHETKFATFALERMQLSLGPRSAPIPSHDGTFWYICERTGNRYHTVNQKKLGWRNYSKMAKLRTEVEKIMAS